MSIRKQDEVISVLANFAADLFAPAIVRAAKILAQRNGAAPTRNGVRRKQQGLIKNGRLTEAQERTLGEMVKFNKGRGGSIFLLPTQTTPHAQVRVAHGLERNGMIRLREGETFKLTRKARSYQFHK